MQDDFESGKAAPSVAAVDGRRLRREQGRLAVIDATIDLVMEGNAPPTVEQVAARAGVSVASLFRYFLTIDDLRREAISRCFDRCAPLGVFPPSVLDRVRAASKGWSRQGCGSTRAWSRCCASPGDRHRWSPRWRRP